MRTLPSDAHFHADMTTGCDVRGLKMQSANHHAAKSERVRLFAYGSDQ